MTNTLTLGTLAIGQNLNVTSTGALNLGTGGNIGGNSWSPTAAAPAPSPKTRGWPEALTGTSSITAGAARHPA